MVPKNDQTIIKILDSIFRRFFAPTKLRGIIDTRPRRAQGLQKTAWADPWDLPLDHDLQPFSKRSVRSLTRRSAHGPANLFGWLLVCASVCLCASLLDVFMFVCLFLFVVVCSFVIVLFCLCVCLCVCLFV